jgi:hypothetical protein
MMAGIFFIGLVKNLNGVICVHHDGRSAFEISFNGHDCFDKHYSHTDHQDQGLKDSLKNEVLRRNPLNKNIKDPLPEPRMNLGSGLENRQSRIFQWVLNNQDSCQDITIDYNLNTVFVLKKFFHLTTASIPIFLTQKITEPYSLKPVIRLFYERLCLKTLKTVILRL